MPAFLSAETLMVNKSPTTTTNFGAPVKCGLRHPVIWSDMDEIKMGELLRKVVKGHPEFTLIPHPGKENIQRMFFDWSTKEKKQRELHQGKQICC